MIHGPYMLTNEPIRPVGATMYYMIEATTTTTVIYVDNEYNVICTSICGVMIDEHTSKCSCVVM